MFDISSRWREWKDSTYAFFLGSPGEMNARSTMPSAQWARARQVS
jgi:hypothetical protein